jgi:hypothetical protein
VRFDVERDVSKAQLLTSAIEHRPAHTWMLPSVPSPNQLRSRWP